MAMVLLISAGLMIRTFQKLHVGLPTRGKGARVP